MTIFVISHNSVPWLGFIWANSSLVLLRIFGEVAFLRELGHGLIMRDGHSSPRTLINSSVWPGLPYSMRSDSREKKQKLKV